MLPWENLERGLADRVQTCAAERRAREQAHHYAAWARAAVAECMDDLARDLADRITRFDENVRRGLTLSTVYPSHLVDRDSAGAQRVLCVNLELDQVQIYGQWQPGGAPTLHLLWSRRRQNRYCQMVPIAGGKLQPRHHGVAIDAAQANTLAGYRIVPEDGSGNEIARERVLYRALGLLASGTRQ